MIETLFYILPSDLHEKIKHDASQLGLSVDYFLLEFCDVQGDIISSSNK